MNSQHTPGPWAFNGDACVHNSLAHVAVWAPDGRAVVLTGVFGKSDQHESEANARRIVKCVNAHDELVLALEKLADAVETRNPAHEDYLVMCAQEARAAIAKANRIAP